jgi:hypothetical protein
MFSAPMMVIIIAVMTAIHISLWQIFPVKLRDVFMSNPILAFMIDLMGSVLIEYFTGVASVVGVCNLAASVMFGVYAFWYSRQKGIVGLSLGSYRLFDRIPVFPRVMVVYLKSGKSWRA